MNLVSTYIEIEQLCCLFALLHDILCFHCSLVYSFSSDGLRGKDIVHFLLLVVLLRAFTNLIAKDWPKSFTLLPYCAPLN